MLSICIPTYNYNVEKLVADLSRQCKESAIDFEILVREDGLCNDWKEKNANIENVYGVRHIVSKENLGRSATRNRLADEAKYEKLIFIDCDSEIPDDNFIKRYLENYNYDVVCGGTTYNDIQYSPEISLRYTFGTKVEKTSATKRNRNPYSAFTTNNMMVSKKIFEKIRFCESLKKYGHEDSLFGFELKENNINIIHIDNPVIHTGIEPNEIFLKKTKAGVENLITIKNLAGINPDFLKHIRLYRNYLKINKLCLVWLVKLSFKLFSKSLEKYLISAKFPKLLFFNFFKIGYLCELLK